MIRVFDKKRNFMKSVAGVNVASTKYDPSSCIALQTSLSSPTCLARHPLSGEIYFFDANQIKKITPNGRVKLIAGNKGGSSGDLGLAIDASINAGGDLVISKAGDLYFTNGNRIRKIFSNGTITTVAGSNKNGDFKGDGGLAINALFNSPKSVAISSNGEMVIVDNFNNRLRKILINGTIVTIAGNNTRGFSGDGGLAINALLNSPMHGRFNSKDDYIFMDSINNRIRIIYNDTGIISTLGGIGTVGYSGDGKQATLAEFNYPFYVHVDDRTDEIYVIDKSSVIRKIEKTGIVSSAFRNLNFYSGDGLDAKFATFNFLRSFSIFNNTILLSDEKALRYIDSNGIISTIAGKVGIDGYSQDGLITSETRVSPTCVYNGGVDNLYFCDTNYILRKVTTNFTQIETIAGTRNLFSGNDYFANISLLPNAHGLTVHPTTGDIYITQVSDYAYYPTLAAIRKVDTSGIISLVSGKYGIITPDGYHITNTSFKDPYKMDISPINGDFYICEAKNDKIRKVDSLTGIVSTLVSISKPSYLSLSRDGNFLYVLSTLNSIIYKVDTVFGHETINAGIYGSSGFKNDNVPANSTFLNNPVGIKITNSNIVLVADTQNHRIRSIDPISGNITTIAGIGSWGYSGDNGLATKARLNQPTSLTIFNDTIYFIDSLNAVIRKFTIGGKIYHVAGCSRNGYKGDFKLASNACLDSPVDLEVLPNGDLLISELKRIRKIDKTTGIITTIAGGIGNEGLALNSSIFVETIEIDKNQDILITERWDIRRVDKNQIIHAFIGSTMYGSNTIATGNNPLELDFTGVSDMVIVNGQNYLIIDTMACVVRLIDKYGNITIIAGNGEVGSSGDYGLATKAQLNNPIGAVKTPNGDIYISESSKIRKVDSISGNISTVASGSNFFNSISPSFMKSVGDDVYFIDFNNEKTIRKLSKECPRYSIVNPNNSSECECFDGYFGDLCEDFKCFGIHYLNETSCSSTGLCIGPDLCECYLDLYAGPKCEFFTCFGVSQNDSNVCSGRGICGGLDKCQCKEHYFGNNCQSKEEQIYCYGISNISTVCSGRGTCESTDHCKCNTTIGNYVVSGSECEILTCIPILEVNTEVIYTNLDKLPLYISKYITFNECYENDITKFNLKWSQVQGNSLNFTTLPNYDLVIEANNILQGEYLLELNWSVNNYGTFKNVKIITVEEEYNILLWQSSLTPNQVTINVETDPSERSNLIDLYEWKWNCVNGITRLSCGESIMKQLIIIASQKVHNFTLISDIEIIELQLIINNKTGGSIINFPVKESVPIITVLSIYPQKTLFVSSDILQFQLLVELDNQVEDINHLIVREWKLDNKTLDSSLLLPGSDTINSNKVLLDLSHLASTFHIITFTVTRSVNSFAIYNFEFKIAENPVPCSCSISPTIGYSIDTEFTISCSSCLQSSNEILQLSFLDYKTSLKIQLLETRSLNIKTPLPYTGGDETITLYISSKNIQTGAKSEITSSRALLLPPASTISEIKKKKASWDATYKKLSSNDPKKIVYSYSSVTSEAMTKKLSASSKRSLASICLNSASYCEYTLSCICVEGFKKSDCSMRFDEWIQFTNEKWNSSKYLIEDMLNRNEYQLDGNQLSFDMVVIHNLLEQFDEINEKMFYNIFLLFTLRIAEVLKFKYLELSNQLCKTMNIVFNLLIQSRISLNNGSILTNLDEFIEISNNLNNICLRIQYQSNIQTTFYSIFSSRMYPSEFSNSKIYFYGNNSINFPKQMIKFFGNLRKPVVNRIIKYNTNLNLIEGNETKENGTIVQKTIRKLPFMVSCENFFQQTSVTEKIISYLFNFENITLSNTITTVINSTTRKNETVTSNIECQSSIDSCLTESIDNSNYYCKCSSFARNVTLIETIIRSISFSNIIIPTNNTIPSPSPSPSQSISNISNVEVENSETDIVEDKHGFLGLIVLIVPLVLIILISIGVIVYCVKGKKSTFVPTSSKEMQTISQQHVV